MKRSVVAMDSLPGSPSLRMQDEDNDTFANGDESPSLQVTSVSVARPRPTDDALPNPKSGFPAFEPASPSPAHKRLLLMLRLLRLGTWKEKNVQSTRPMDRRKNDVSAAFKSRRNQHRRKLAAERATQ